MFEGHVKGFRLSRQAEVRVDAKGNPYITGYGGTWIPGNGNRPWFNCYFMIRSGIARKIIEAGVTEGTNKLGKKVIFSDALKEGVSISGHGHLEMINAKFNGNDYLTLLFTELEEVKPPRKNTPSIVDLTANITRKEVK